MKNEFTNINTNDDFKNLDTVIDKDFLKLKVKDMSSKDFTYIFARNGVGKTYYTRNIKDQDILIYNVDYKNKYIYTKKTDKNTEEVQTESSSSNKSQSFDVLIGENISGIVTELEEVSAKTILISEKYNSMIGVDDRLKLGHFKLELPSESKAKSNIDLIHSADDKLINEINTKIIEYDKYDNLKNVMEDLNNIIELSNEYSDLVNKYNEIANQKYIGLDKNIVDVHHMALDIKIPWKFVDYDVDRNKLKSYYEEINDEKIGPSKDLNNKFDEIKDLLKSRETRIINSENSNFIETFNQIKEIYKNVKSVDPKDMNLLKEIKKFEILTLENRDEMELAIIGLLEENRYLLLKDSRDLRELINEAIENDNKRSILEKQKKDESIELDKSIASRINHFLDFFDMKKMEVSLKTTSQKGKSGVLTIDFINEKKMTTLSEGELSIFSFCFFLANVELKAEKNNGNFAIVIDDPFDSNDHTKIYKFKDIPFKFHNETIKSFGKLQCKYNKRNNSRMKIVLLTHNIQVIYSMISSLKDDIEENRKFNKIKSTHSIDVREWIKNESDVIEEVISAASFFPREDRILKGLLKLVYNLISGEYDSDKVWTSYKLIWYLILRLSEEMTNIRSGENFKNNQATRGKIKSILQSPAWGDSYKRKEDEAIENAKFFLNRIDGEKQLNIKNLEMINEITEKISENATSATSIEFKKKVMNESIFIKSGFDKEEAKIMIRYFKRFSKYLELAYDGETTEMFRRLRHKEYLFSSIVAFSLEEFDQY